MAESTKIFELYRSKRLFGWAILRLFQDLEALFLNGFTRRYVVRAVGSVAEEERWHPLSSSLIDDERPRANFQSSAFANLDITTSLIAWIDDRIKLKKDQWLFPE